MVRKVGLWEKFNRAVKQFFILEFQQQIEEKDKEIAKLTKAIKRLKKELKEKEEGGKIPANF